MLNPGNLHNPAFRFREREIELIHYCWSQGQSILLTGIRRTGKSEVLKAALHRWAAAGRPIVFLDVQKQDNLARFYRQLLEALLRGAPPTLAEQLVATLARVPSGLSNWLRGQIRSINVPEVLAIELAPPDEQLLRYWQPLVEQIEALIAQHDAATLPVIGIDELPFMLENLLRAGVAQRELIVMLASLRSLRDAGLRMIVAGSISFENLLSLHEIPHTVLGGLSRQAIAPFSRDEAADFLAEKLAGRPAAVYTAMQLALDTLPDYVPEFLRITANHLHICRAADECEASLHGAVLPEIRRNFLQQFDERLAKNYTHPEQHCAELILDAIAAADQSGNRLDGSRLPEGYRKVLLKLQYDNFLIEGEDFKWCFSLNLIRLWWRASRGMS